MDEKRMKNPLYWLLAGLLASNLYLAYVIEDVGNSIAVEVMDVAVHLGFIEKDLSKIDLPVP